MNEFIFALMVLAVVAFFYFDNRRKKADYAEEERIRRRKEKTRVSKENEREAKEKADRQFWAEAEKQRKAEEEIAAAIKKKTDDERECAEQVKILAVEQLTKRITILRSNLPFYTSDKVPSVELADHDQKMWEGVVKLLEEESDKQATLYFVKIRSLLDDNEYYKIGITTTGVEVRFKKSTQVELVEIVCVFETEIWKAAYLEYHFLREFRLYNGLASSLGEFRPEVGFSGYTEVVRSNSVSKISEFFGELDAYNKLGSYEVFGDD